MIVVVLITVFYVVLPLIISHSIDLFLTFTFNNVIIIVIVTYIKSALLLAYTSHYYY